MSRSYSVNTEAIHLQRMDGYTKEYSSIKRNLFQYFALRVTILKKKSTITG